MLPWQQDRQHAPEPMSPMAGHTAEIFARGFSDATAAYKVPLGVKAARLNSYYYMAIAPNVPPEQMEAAGAAAEPLVKAAAVTFADRWRNEWLPELQATWARVSSVDVPALSTDGLISHIADLEAVYRRAWQIHFELLIPAMVGFDQFVRLHEQVFGTTGTMAPYKLLQGFDSMSLKAGRGLWALSRQALADPTVAKLVESTPAEKLYAALGESEAGRNFRAAVDAYKEEYGRRSDTVQELRHPSWIEDPAPIFNAIKGYLTQTDDPDDTHRALAAERERLVAEAREKLAGAPPELKGGFEALLSAAQGCSWVQEDHNFWIDQRSLHEMRQLSLEVGRRLQATGVLDARDDVFLLTMPEAVASLRDPSINRRPVMAERRAEMEHFATIPAPPFAGMDYGPPPENPITQAITRFFGGPPPEARSANMITGLGGSAGKVTGTARVIITIDQAHRLNPGDILVTATTSPPWTPFFGIAGGIVTDTGGPLSHCAIVAREYAIPAVVGTMVATARIQDGMTLEVDGDAGEVRIL
jgi:pyruvate,water dikinase